MGDDSLPSPPLAYQSIDDYNKDGYEGEGSKRKEWLRAPDGARWLFKEGRNNAERWVGEDTSSDHTENWAEIVAERVCACLGLPCAEYRLASYGGRNGTISRDFLEAKALRGTELFLALEYMRGYYTERGVDNPDLSRNHREYTIPASVFRTPLLGANPPPECGEPPFYYFVGYLVLDALISNCDRHHQNWGFLEKDGDKKMPRFAPAVDHEMMPRFAPTFDHGAGFCKERPAEQKERLTTKDRGYTVAAFCEKGKTRFRQAAGGKCLKPTEAVGEACRIINGERPGCGVAGRWAEIVDGLDVAGDIALLINAFPCDIIPDVCKEFTVRMLKINRARVLTALREAGE